MVLCGLQETCSDKCIIVINCNERGGNLSPALEPTEQWHTGRGRPPKSCQTQPDCENC